MDVRYILQALVFCVIQHEWRQLPFIVALSLPSPSQLLVIFYATITWIFCWLGYHCHNFNTAYYLSGSKSSLSSQLQYHIQKIHHMVYLFVNIFSMRDGYVFISRFIITRSATTATFLGRTSMTLLHPYLHSSDKYTFPNAVILQPIDTLDVILLLCSLLHR